MREKGVTSKRPELFKKRLAVMLAKHSKNCHGIWAEDENGINGSTEHRLVETVASEADILDFVSQELELLIEEARA